MAHPLMPKGTAVWLVDNTTLTFKQISEFCGLHELEVQAIADGDVAVGMQGLDPVKAGALTAEEVERCEGDPNAVLQMVKPNIPQPKIRQKGARYTPVSKRGDRPNAISWLVKNYPELSDAQISKLIGTTKPTITSVRDRSHWNITNIKAENPVGLGLCAATDLEKAVAVARARSKTVHAPKADAEPQSTDVPIATPPMAAEAPVEPQVEPQGEALGETLADPGDTTENT